MARTPWPATLGQDSFVSLNDWPSPQFFLHLCGIFQDSAWAKHTPTISFKLYVSGCVCVCTHTRMGVCVCVSMCLCVFKRWELESLPRHLDGRGRTDQAIQTGDFICFTLKDFHTLRGRLDMNFKRVPQYILSLPFTLKTDKQTYPSNISLLLGQLPSHPPLTSPGENQSLPLLASLYL